MANDHSWSRRDFIRKPALCFAAAKLLGQSESLFALPSAAEKVIMRPLGKTGIALPVISMGVTRADVPALVRRSYEIGVRHFDTSPTYQQGRNEEMVGTVVKELGVRTHVVIATKTAGGPDRQQKLTTATIREDLKASLKRLQSDYVDILYMQAADSADTVVSESVLEGLAALKKEGKARFIGVSAHSGQEAVLQEVAKLGVHDVVLLGFNYTMQSNQGLLAAIDSAAKKGIGLIAMKTMAGGLPMPGGPPPGGRQGMPPGPPPGGPGAQGGPGEGPGEPPQRTPPKNPTAMLKWVLQHDSICTIIAAYDKLEHLEQNFAVTRDLSYTDSEKKFLANPDSVAQAQFCQQCGECRASCPQCADIPTLMRSHMYAFQYRDEVHAQETLTNIARGRGLEVCGQCDFCQATCANTVNIAFKIEQLKTISKGVFQI